MIATTTAEAQLGPAFLDYGRTLPEHARDLDFLLVIAFQGRETWNRDA
jgi:hypothetical protein